MRYPDFLGKNGTIGFVAPSFGCATEPYRSTFDNAQKKLSQMGFNLWLGPNCYADKGIGISNTPAACAEELMDCYVNQDCDCIISCGGGELMCETIEQIDFDRIASAKPKWFMGYSDNTHFTFLLNVLCDTAAIYGPNIAPFGMREWHRSLYDALDVLQGNKMEYSGYDKWESESLKSADNPLVPYNTTNDSVLHIFPEDRVCMEGRLLGGCMDCLENLRGTKYDRVKDYIDRYADDGIIWFMESCSFDVMSIRRTLWSMDQSGWFRNCKGFIFGRPLMYNQPMMGLDQYEAVLGVVGKYNVPVIMDADIGHLPPSIPIVSGALAKITASSDGYTIKYRFD